MRVCGKEFNLSDIAHIDFLIQKDPDLSMRKLSRQVCEEMQWRGENGRLKEMSCRKALLKLQDKGRVKLPITKGPWAFQQRVKREGPGLLGTLCEIRCPLKALGEIEIHLIGSRHSQVSVIWKEMMERYHYLGAGPLCGAQLRYVIKSTRMGWLGGVSFSGAAWRVEDRDHWIGWSDQAREQNLGAVVNNSRFLILPTVTVPHLASHLLGRLMRRLPEDFAKRYGYAPVLVETFVDREKFEGTCYRAANWQEAGMTKGRGRQDFAGEGSLSKKRIFVYPLSLDFRERLCRESASVLESVALPVVVREPVDWAQEEFGQAVFGDDRIRKRLEGLGRSFYAKPGSSLPEACGSRAKAKAAYRFFDNEKVTMEAILRSHFAATQRRVAEHRVILAVQDTTSLNYTAHPETDDLGPIHIKGSQAVGLELHGTMAITPEGVPLGLLDVQCWARDSKEAGKRERRHELPIEEKESFKWIKSYRAVREVQRLCPQTICVSVGDRESDIHALFAEAASVPDGPSLLIRSERSRNRQTEEGKLWEILGEEEIAGYQELFVPRQGSRKARVATLEVRWRSVELKSPQGVSHLPSVRVDAVYARETECSSPEETPIEWMLLTTVLVGSFQDACERLGWYAKRWGIEVYHRTLKSGCKIEDRQLGNARRLESCLAIDLVVAWRIYYLTRQGRETPNVPCTVFFEDSEWKALVCFVNKDPVVPKSPPTLREAVRMVASLGGFLGRKGDGEPGTQTTWRGLQRLDDITATWCVVMNQPSTEAHTVYAQTDYG